MPSRRDVIAASAATVVVAVAVAAGFLNLGGPSGQREIQLDRKRIENLTFIAGAIHNQFVTSKVLPLNVEQAVRRRPASDPVTNQPYQYWITGASTYSLCATFSRSSQGNVTPESDAFWEHPAGRHCYVLDAAQPIHY